MRYFISTCSMQQCKYVMSVKTGVLRNVTLCFTGSRWSFANPADLPTPQTAFSCNPPCAEYVGSNSLCIVIMLRSELVAGRIVQRCALHQWCTDFPKKCRSYLHIPGARRVKWWPIFRTHNIRCEKGDMKTVPYLEPAILGARKVTWRQSHI